jgi:hypothetical protein
MAKRKSNKRYLRVPLSESEAAFIAAKLADGFQFGWHMSYSLEKVERGRAWMLGRPVPSHTAYHASLYSKPELK